MPVDGDIVGRPVCDTPCRPGNGNGSPEPSRDWSPFGERPPREGAIGFADEKDAMFDAHHLRPLAVGERKSRVDDLVVLRPTCHRWARAKTEDKLSPVGANEIARQRSESEAPE